MTNPFSVRTVSTLFTLVATAGCTANAQQAGDFTMTVTAPTGAPAQLTGFAPSFSSDRMGQWYVQLVTPGGQSSLMLLYAGAGRPATGTYRIVDVIANDGKAPAGEFVALGNVDPAVLSVQGLGSLDGTITITSSSSTSVAGTFTYRAGVAGRATGVTITGQFRSRNKEQ
jgi:hypothetical protein